MMKVHSGLAEASGFAFERHLSEIECLGGQFRHVLHGFCGQIEAVEASFGAPRPCLPAGLDVAWPFQAFGGHDAHLRHLEYIYEVFT